MFLCFPHMHVGVGAWDMKHVVHYLSFGVILFDHVEPDGRMAVEVHEDDIWGVV